MSDPSLVDDIRKNWEEPYGDRRQELVFIGTEIDKQDIKNRLETCLLTDEEFNQGPEVWQSFNDPINKWEFVESEEEAELV